MKRCLFLCMLLIVSAAQAQTPIKALIKSPILKVYSKPSRTGQVLLILKKNSSVQVVGIAGAWAKIKVSVKGFQFDGWVEKVNLVKISQPQQPAQMRPVQQQPQRPAGLSNTSNSQLEQFFEPANPPSASSPAPVQQQPQPAPVRRVEEPRVSRSQQQSSSSSDGNWKTDKLIFYGVPGLVYHQYTFGDSTRDAFRYSISGLSAIVGVEYKAFKLFDDLIQIGAIFQTQYAMLNTKTNLLDGTNTQFADVTAKNRLLDIWFKAKMMVDFDKIISKPFLVGITAGYEYMMFSGDDIIDDTGVPVGLYIDQTTKSIPIGILAELHFLDPVVLTLGTDLLISNKTTESPAGFSGSNPSTAIGLAPYFYLNFPIVRRTHYMGLRYQLRTQKTSYTGPSSTRVNSTLNDATTTSVYHMLGLEYSYHF